MQEVKEGSRRDAPGLALAAWCGVGLASIAGIALFAMMTVTFVDVIGRYLFGSPLQGAYELTEFLLPIMVFAALPLVTGREEHVTTGLFEKSIRGAVLVVKRVSLNLAGAAACGYMAVALYRAFGASAAIGESSQLLGVPKAPIIGAAAVMSAVAAALLAVRAAAALRGGRRAAGGSAR